MAKRQLRRTVSVSEEAYVMLTKLAERSDLPMAAWVERHIRNMAGCEGIEVTEHDILDSRTRRLLGRRRTSAEGAETEATRKAHDADAVDEVLGG